MVNCSFNTVHERDMDILFLESLASDSGFTKLVLEKTPYAGKAFQVLSAALSVTEADLGETDICVVLQVEGRRIGLLIEDKVDALAMPDQHLRYHKRGETAVSRGDYDTYEVFIFCPEKYHESNEEAKKYEHFCSYETFKRYFDGKDDAISKIRSQQLAQAIERARKPSEAIINEAANLFFTRYKAYQKQYYPELDLRTGDGSNGWWPHYSTRLGNAYIYHKRLEGFVDLTFPNAAGKLDVVQNLAVWLRAHDVPNVIAVQTGKAAALRIEVPQIPRETAFEEVEKSEIQKCFHAIQMLTNFANVIEDSYGISRIKAKKKS